MVSLLNWYAEIHKMYDLLPNYLQAERNRIAHQQQVEQEERLAQELKRRNLEKMRDEKMRQQIRENR